MQDKYIIGLWKKTSPKTKTEYCNGKIRINNITYRVLLFSNKSKKSEKSPDFSVMLTKV